VEVLGGRELRRCEGCAGAVGELLEALVLSDVFAGGQDDGEGDAFLSADGAPASDDGVDCRAEGVPGGFGCGSSVDEQSAGVAEEEVGERGFPVDAGVFAEDVGVFVVGEDLDARVAIGGGED